MKIRFGIVATMLRENSFIVLVLKNLELPKDINRVIKPASEMEEIMQKTMTAMRTVMPIPQRPDVNLTHLVISQKQYQDMGQPRIGEEITLEMMKNE